MQKTLLIAFWSPGPMELVVILIIAVLLFGTRLPKIARGMGRSLFEFKKGVKEAETLKDDLEKDILQTEQKTTDETKTE